MMMPTRCHCQDTRTLDMYQELGFGCLLLLLLLSSSLLLLLLSKSAPDDGDVVDESLVDHDDGSVDDPHGVDE
jgi:hypothetical protein